MFFIFILVGMIEVFGLFWLLIEVGVVVVVDSLFV